MDKSEWNASYPILTQLNPTLDPNLTQPNPNLT